MRFIEDKELYIKVRHLGEQIENYEYLKLQNKGQWDRLVKEDEDKINEAFEKIVKFIMLERKIKFNI